MAKYIWIKNKRYYYFDKYTTWNEAYEVAKTHKRTNPKNRYFILTEEKGLLAPYKIYKLYMTRVFTL